MSCFWFTIWSSLRAFHHISYKGERERKKNPLERERENEKCIRISYPIIYNEWSSNCKTRNWEVPIEKRGREDGGSREADGDSLSQSKQTSDWHFSNMSCLKLTHFLHLYCTCGHARGTSFYFPHIYTHLYIDWPKPLLVCDHIALVVKIPWKAYTRESKHEKKWHAPALFVKQPRHFLTLKKI